VTTPQVSIDENLCIGARNCESVAPHLFVVGDDDISRLRSDASHDIESARRAVELCPTGAIMLLESDLKD